MDEISKKKTILVAEDNPSILNMMEETLTRAGYGVRLARDGKEAVDLARADPPDLAILDIHMPGMDGYEACRMLKKNERTRDVPVVFVSGLFESYNKIKAFECGGVDYLMKPIQMDELVARISVHIALREKIQELEKFNKIMLEREMRIVELKKEVNDLATTLGREAPYPDIWRES